MSQLRFAALQFAIAASLTLVASAQNPTVTTVYSSGGTQSRYDMVILADGYQAAEQSRFNQDVQTFLTRLFQMQPYATFSAYYNVHTVFRASVDSGADHPDVTPPIYKNTVYDATYNTGGTARCLYIQNTTLALADAALAPANEGRVLVFVNDSRYGGCASTFAVSYNGSSMADVQIHEIGHSIGGLADEYDYPNQTYQGSEPSQANITTSTTGQKWSHWHGTEGVSAFQGAGYYLYGLYRPKSNCMMRALGQALCPVCREQIALRTNAVADPVTPVMPQSSAVTVVVPNTQIFQISHFVPSANAPTVTWEVDGVTVPGAVLTVYLFDSATKSLGQHTVKAHVTDHSTQVRLDPSLAMRETQTWTVTVTNPAAAQLHVASFQMPPIWTQAGAAATINASVTNDGPATATNFYVDFFVTPTQPWTTQSIYLGKHLVSSVAAGQTAVFQHAVQLPWDLDPGVYYVYAVADRTNQVFETNEGDNERITAIIAQAGACETKLEFQDALTYPRDQNAITLSTGGTVHPTVVAKCMPGAYYLIAWGASGTQPGTPIGGGLTVPLNRDAFTDLGLLGVNSAWFPGFFGPLNSLGVGRGTMQIPVNSGLVAMSSHLAGLLIDSNGFAAVTNPIALQLQ